MPGETYEALGRFLERQTPYVTKDLPSFGSGDPDEDKQIFTVLSEHLKRSKPFNEDGHDCHVVAVAGPYKNFDKEKPSNLKSEDLDDTQKGELLHWEFDGLDNLVTKAFRVEYTHTRKADNTLCHSFLLIGFTGDDHP
jgi:hypothetical protein